MSIESAKLFIERMKTDHAFAQGVTNCKNAQEREAFVRAAGLEFTVEELRQVPSELTDDDLVGLNGGNNMPSICGYSLPLMGHVRLY